MKYVSILILLVLSLIQIQAQTITFNGCPNLFDNNTFVFNKTGTDVTGRNIYETTPINGDQPCSGLGTCEFRIAWNNTLSRWELLADEGNGTFTTPYLIYYNTTSSFPNPPSLNLGVWQENTAITGNFCNGNLTTTNATLTGAVQDNTILPVTLTQFTGEYQNGFAQLNWQSGVESNFAMYEVEKSVDAKVFVKATTVSAKGSNSSYTAQVPQSENKAWYRLKLIDKDGSHAYSEIIQITNTQNSSLTTLKVYPNPVVNGVLNIESATSCRAVLYDTQGREIKSVELQSGKNVLSVPNLQSGVYFIKTSAGGQAKIIVQ